MTVSIKIPIPQSGIMLDPKNGKPTREWYIFWENLGVVSGNVSALADGKVWIGDATDNPVAYALSGDVLLSNVGVATLQSSANVVELVEDTIGAILTDTATIDFTYDDATPTITADLKDTAVVPGSYEEVDLTVDQQGRITAASSSRSDYTQVFLFGGA